MAQTYIGHENVPKQLVPKVFSAQLFERALWDSFWVSKMSGLGTRGFVRAGRSDVVGTGEDYPVQVLRDLQKTQGDTIYFDLFADIKGDGVYGDNQLKGKEDSLVSYTDGVSIDQVRKAVNVGGRMSRQRTKHDLRMVGQRKLIRWYAQFYDEAITCYLAGTRGVATAGWNLPVTWNGFANNPLEEPNEENRVCVDSSGDISHDVADATEFKLKHLDLLKDYIGSMEDKPVPLSVGSNDPFYIVLLHPKAVLQMKQDTSAQSWLEIQKYAGVRGERNPLFTGALGRYDMFWMHEYTKVPVIESGGKKYACNLVVGCQAAVLAFGRNSGKFSVDWYEETDDRGNQLIIVASTMCGIKKVRFNGKDFGVIVFYTLIG